MMMDNSGHAIDLAAMGLLYSLEELTTDEELTAQYQEGPLDSGKFEGKYYSVPWNMDCTGLYYNKERLDELGIDVPTTWKELSDAVDKVKEAGYGGIITYQSAYAFYSFFYQNECPVIDTSGDVPKVVIDNEEGKEAWNYDESFEFHTSHLRKHEESFEFHTSYLRKHEESFEFHTSYLRNKDFPAVSGKLKR